MGWECPPSLIQQSLTLIEQPFCVSEAAQFFYYGTLIVLLTF